MGMEVEVELKMEMIMLMFEMTLNPFRSLRLQSKCILGSCFASSRASSNPSMTSPKIKSSRSQTLERACERSFTLRVYFHPPSSSIPIPPLFCPLLLRFSCFPLAPLSRLSIWNILTAISFSIYKRPDHQKGHHPT